MLEQNEGLLLGSRSGDLLIEISSGTEGREEERSRSASMRERERQEEALLTQGRQVEMREQQRLERLV